MSKKILVIDATYLGNKPNREKNIINMLYWVESCGADLTIATTKSGIDFYKELLGNEVAGKVKFIRLPLSNDFIPNGAIGVVFEYAKRIIGSFLYSKTFKLNDFCTVFAITAILPDVAIALIMKRKLNIHQAIVVFDNFVKSPNERDGNYFHNLIPYLSHKLSLFLMKMMDVVFIIMANKKDLEKAKNIFKGVNAKLIEDINGVDVKTVNEVEKCDKELDILFIGRLLKDKGIFDLVEVVSRVKQKIPNIKVCMIGQGSPDILGQIEKMIDNMELKSNIELKGYVSKQEKYSLLKSAKSFCFFSYYESYPIAILEAMSCKKKIFSYKLESFQYHPFDLGDIESFERNKFDDIAFRIVEFISNYENEKSKEIDLRLIDQNSSAQLQYDNF